MFKLFSTNFTIKKNLNFKKLIPKSNTNSSCSIEKKKYFFKKEEKNDMQPKERFRRMKMEITNNNIQVQSMLGEIKKQVVINEGLLKLYKTNLKIKQIKRVDGLIQDQYRNKLKFV